MPKRAKRSAGESGGHDVRLSKKLSNVLRHRVHENGLGDVLRPDGYVPLAALLATPGFQGVSIPQVRAVVEQNDKQRFALREEAGGQLFIRANQGHTITGIDADQLLTRLDDDAIRALGGRAVHGTNHAAWRGIVASGGLSPMARHHVHLAAGLPGEGGVISGMRASADVHVWVDLRSAAAAGIPFFRSANGVILTPGDPRGTLPIGHFERVVDSAGRVWRDGTWAREPLGEPAAADGSSDAQPQAPAGPVTAASEALAS